MQHLQPFARPSVPIGLDYSAYALQLCRQSGATRLIQGDAAAPPLADETFDLIVSIDVIQHLAPAGADQRMLRGCARLLRPGGWLYLRTNSALGHRPLQGVDPGRYRRYERRELRIMLREVGLQPVRATYLNCLPGLWAALVEYLRPPQQDLPAAGPRLTIRSPNSSLRNRLLLAILLLEAAWVGRLRRDLPFGHSLACLAQKQ
jgi:SAM-dependent methyltransferase